MPEATTMHMNTFIAAVGRRARLVSLALVAAACTTGGDSVTQPTNNGGIPWDLQLNYNAITAAVGDEIQLQATAVHSDGTPVAGPLPSIVYTSTDTMVKVSEAGVVVGRAPRSNVVVVARMSSYEGNWTIADTLRMMVTDTVISYSSFGLLFNGPTLVPANRSRRYDGFLFDSAGKVIRGAAGDTIRPLVHYRSLVPRARFDISNPWSATGTPRNIGDVTIRGTSYVYGHAEQAETSFRITYPDSAVLLIHRVDLWLEPSPSMMSQTDLTVLRNGKVAFRNNNTSQDVDIVFDDTTAVIGGNIPKVAKTTPLSVVQFPNLGTFTYHSSKGFGGTITVVDP